MPVVAFYVSNTLDTVAVRYKGPTYSELTYSDMFTGSYMGLYKTLENGLFTVSTVFIRFLTDSIPLTATINSAVLKISPGYASSSDSKNMNIDWYSQEEWPISSTDWVETAVPNIASIPVNSLSVGTVIPIQLPDPNTTINRTGYTCFRITMSAGEPTASNTVFLVDETNTTYPVPVLEIDYTDSSGGGGGTTVAVGDSGTGIEGIGLTAQGTITDSGFSSHILVTTASTSVQDAGAGTDTVSVSAAGNASIQDAGVLNDVVQVLSQQGIPDQGVGTEIISISILNNFVMFDVGSGLDSALIRSTNLLAETGTGSDILQVGRAGNSALTDTANATDSVTVAAVGIGPAVELQLADSGLARDFFLQWLPIGEGSTNWQERNEPGLGAGRKRREG